MKLDSLTKIALKFKKIDSEIVELRSMRLLHGKDGKTPIKGEDYLTSNEIKTLKAEITPIKGEDYLTDNEIETIKASVRPIKGVDYRDGVDGVTKIINETDADEIVDALHALPEYKKLNAEKGINQKSLKDMVEKYAPRSGGGTIRTVGGNSAYFLDLLDTPSSYVGHANKYIRVNSAEDGLEFASVSGGGGTWGTITGTLSDQTDLQAALDLKIETETDPIFSASAAANITVDDIANWNDAYLWGDHATAGYLTQAVADTLYSPIGHNHNSSYLQITNNLSDLNNTTTARTNLDVYSTSEVDALIPTLNDLLPDQTGNSGKYLTTDGSNASWATVSAGVTDHGALTGLSDDDHSQYVIKTPTTDARNVIQPSTATVTPFTLRGATSQSDPLITFENNSSTILSRVNSSGVYQFNETTPSSTLIPIVTNNNFGTNRITMTSRGQLSLNYSEIGTAYAVSSVNRYTTLTVGNSYNPGSDPEASMMSIYAITAKSQKSNYDAYGAFFGLTVQTNGADGTDYGVNAGARYFIQVLGSANVNNVYAQYNHVRAYGTGTIGSLIGNYIYGDTLNSNTISSFEGLRIGSLGSGAGTKPTTVYGIRLFDQNQGSSTNYAIHTLSGNIVINDGGDANTDVRIEGDTDANLLFTDASTDRVGIGMNNPAYKLDVTGEINSSAGYRIAGTAGVDGSFTTADLKTVTVTKGIITAIV